MPDITKCNNKDCPLSYRGYRFNCKPSEYNQSYAEFKPEVDESFKFKTVVNCEFYIETK